jgi:hypothetical protein
MPVARGRGVDARSAFVVGVTGVVIALVVGGFMLYLSSRDDIQVRLGDDTFRDLDAESSAEEIAARGPLTFLDLAGGNRDIFVQHIGDDPATGWYAFDVRPAGEPRECALVWQPDDQQFVDNGECSTELVFPANGEGLPQYPATVNDGGDVVIDLNAAQRDTTTTTQSQGS